MASWSIIFGPALKTTVNSAIGAAALSQASGFDPGVPLNLFDSTKLVHFAAAMRAAQGALASLLGPATRAQVTLTGLSRITITAVEVL
jgi:hypothetical protein